MVKNIKAIFQEIESVISQDKIKTRRLELLNCDAIKENYAILICFRFWKKLSQKEFGLFYVSRRNRETK